MLNTTGKSNKKKNNNENYLRIDNYSKLSIM